MDYLNPWGSLLTPPPVRILVWNLFSKQWCAFRFTTGSMVSHVTWIYHDSIVAELVRQAAHLLRGELSKQDKKTSKAFWAAFSCCAPKRRRVRRLLQRERSLSPRTEAVWGRREESGPDWADLLLKQGTSVCSGSLKVTRSRSSVATGDLRDSWRHYTLASLSPLLLLPLRVSSLTLTTSVSLIFQNLTNSLQEQFVLRIHTGLFGFGCFLAVKCQILVTFTTVIPLYITLCCGQHVGVKAQCQFSWQKSLGACGQSMWPHPCSSATYLGPISNHQKTPQTPGKHFCMWVCVEAHKHMEILN